LGQIVYCAAIIAAICADAVKYPHANETAASKKTISIISRCAVIVVLCSFVFVVLCFITNLLLLGLLGFWKKKGKQRGLGMFAQT
jgi:chromate transport protein ChrA